MGPVDKAAARLPHSADLEGSLQRDLPLLPHGVAMWQGRTWQGGMPMPIRAEGERDDGSVAAFTRDVA
jgi:hypothetical protein